MCMSCGRLLPLTRPVSDLLLSHGVDFVVKRFDTPPEWAQGPQVRSILDLACMAGAAECALHLLDAGAELSFLTFREGTRCETITCAVRGRSLEIIDAVLARGMVRAVGFCFWKGSGWGLCG